MLPPAQMLEDADFLAYAAVPERPRFTARLKLFAGEDRIGAVPNLAICKPHDEPGLLLLHCDESWDIVGLQGWSVPITTVAAMKQQAERYYVGLMPSWKDVPSGDA